MTALSEDALRSRIQRIKASVSGTTVPTNYEAAIQSTISVLSLVYGASSPQLARFQSWSKRRQDTRDIQISGHYERRLARELGPLLDAALADLDAGLTTSVRVHAKGEILGDFLALAREALETKTVGSDRVAAVLAAAALEETLKQLGVMNGVDVYSRDLRGVIQQPRRYEPA